MSPPLLGLLFWKNASHWGNVKNVKNVKNLKGLLTKKVLKTGEMLKMLKVFWVLAPPSPHFGGGGQDPENF